MIRARTGSAQYSVSQPKIGAVEFCHKEIGNGKRQWSLVIGGQILVLPFTSFYNMDNHFLRKMVDVSNSPRFTPFRSSLKSLSRFPCLITVVDSEGSFRSTLNDLCHQNSLSCKGKSREPRQPLVAEIHPKKTLIMCSLCVRSPC